MAQKPARSPASRWGGSAGEEEGGRLATWMADAMSRGGGVVPEKILESWRWRSPVFASHCTRRPLPSFRCPIWNGAPSDDLSRLSNPTPGVTVPQVTLDSRPWARPCPASTWRTNPSSSPNFAVCCSLFLFYFIFISISSWGFQSVAVLCPAAFQHHDGVVDSSSFRGGLSLPSASGRGGLRFGVLTLEGVPGVVGISSKQPEHSLHV